MLEFTLIGIPLIFVLISIFEIARGMWLYESLSHGLKSGSRYAIVHGINCSSGTNTCGAEVKDIAAVIHNTSSGLVPADVTITMESDSQSVQCVLATCLTDTTQFPSSQPGNLVGANITFTGTYRFQSALAMFWPGAHGGGVGFPTVNLPASTQEKIQF
ncbi:MAG TPA: hypothetical protein VET69_14955 [Terriglobales bacterium]|nr:hypothetical protein [Terriglobales bacterium]